MSLDFVPSYVVLCLVQGLLVLASWRPFRVARSSLLGLVLPVAMLAAGVGIVRAFSGGADALTTLAAVATPLLAALVGRLRGWRLAWLYPPAAIGLYVIAWRNQDTLLADAAGVLLIAAACLTLAAAFSSVAPARALAIGIMLLVVLDVILVWGNRQIEPAMLTLHEAAPPTVALPGGQAVPLPALQEITFGHALMGWLDLLAPALLATLVAGRAWPVRGAVALTVTASALLWGLLLFLDVTSPIPATVPALAGLALVAVLDRRWLPAPEPVTGPVSD
ncbi:MAG: hypothetical protein U0R69_09270 [Gaiellales bacterium]